MVERRCPQKGRLFSFWSLPYFYYFCAIIFSHSNLPIMKKTLLPLVLLALTLLFTSCDNGINHYFFNAQRFKDLHTLHFAIGYPF